MKTILIPISRALLLGTVLTGSVRAIEAPKHDAAPAAPAAAPEAAKPEAAPAAPAKQTYLGVGSEEVPAALGKHLGLVPGTGLLLRMLDPEGPAAKAGFVEDDVILKFDGKAVESHDQLAGLVRSRKPGDSVRMDFIHEGKPGNRDVVLGEHDAVQADAGGLPDAGVLKMLDGMPADQARAVREAIERSMKEMQANGARAGGAAFGAAGDMRDMEKQMKKMMDDARAAAPGANPGKAQIHMGFNATVRLLDDKGSIEMKKKDDQTELRVLDKAGKEVWSGPWDTEQDKAAAPKEVRERASRLNLDPTFKGNGIRILPGGIAPQEP